MPESNDARMSGLNFAIVVRKSFYGLVTIRWTDVAHTTFGNLQNKLLTTYIYERTFYKHHTTRLSSVCSFSSTKYTN